MIRNDKYLFSFYVCVNGKVRYKWCCGCSRRWTEWKIGHEKWSSISNSRKLDQSLEGKLMMLKIITIGKVPMIVCANWTDIMVVGGRRACERDQGKGACVCHREKKGQRSAGVFAYVDRRRVGGEIVWGKTHIREGNLVTLQKIYSKAYSTATEQASLDCASWPCWRRLCRVGKKASQAGHECINSKETILRSEDTLEEEPDERERLDTWKSSKLEMLCFVGKKINTLSSLSRTSSAISSNRRLSDIESGGEKGGW